MSSKPGCLPSYRPLGVEGDDKRWPDIPVGNQNLTNTAVVIIGGGISGMCTAIDLLVNRNVRNFVILEKAGGFGGTWYVSLTSYQSLLTPTGGTTSFRAAVVTSSASSTLIPLPRILNGLVDTRVKKRFW